MEKQGSEEAEKQKSGEAEKQRTTEAEKQGKAEKQKAEKQRSRETEIKKQMPKTEKQIIPPPKNFPLFKNNIKKDVKRHQKIKSKSLAGPSLPEAKFCGNDSQKRKFYICSDRRGRNTEIT